MPNVVYYAYHLKRDDYVEEFHVANASDPYQWVETLAPDGSRQKWPSRWRDGVLVFHPPDGYSGGQGLLWHYDPAMQECIRISRANMEKIALRNRHSVVVQGLRA